MLLAVTSLALLTGLPGLSLAAPPPGETAATVETAHDRLQKLFTGSDEADLKRNPLNGLFRGDLRYADRLGDFFSDASVAAERTALEADLAALAAINRASLSPEDQISYDVFVWTRQNALNSFAPNLLALTLTRPLDHFNGLQNFVPELHSGDSVAPYKTLADHENSLKRLSAFAFQIDIAIARFRLGLATDITHPRLIVTNMVDQLDNLLKDGPSASIMMKPLAKLPADLSDADMARLRADYAHVIGDEVNPALQRLRTFLADEYLPHARTSVGLSGLPGGDALYAYLVTKNTTTDMTPDEIHSLGLSEVARIRAGMEKIRKQTGFKGDLPAFFAFIRTDPRFKPKTKDELKRRYEEAGRQINARVPELFSTIPKAPLEIRPVPTFKEKTDAAGSYMPGTPDGSRPGIFYFNTYDLPSRTTPGIETLYLHEAIPGHHFQISLAQENKSLPPFQRFDGNTAFIEGWALYAESLGSELGMFNDPYQLLGRYDDEMLRAMRLVVDTGLHAKGWSREQAIKYMLGNSAMGETDATSEVERYIAYPAQALAYKIGQLTITRLRREAEQKLGARFDIRAFHHEVLMSGALPMAVLEAKIRSWIARQA